MWRMSVLKVCEANCIPDDLFTEKQKEGFLKNKGTKEIPESVAMSLIGSNPDPVAQIEARDTVEALMSFLPRTRSEGNFRNGSGFPLKK